MGTTVWLADGELDGQFTRTLMAAYAGACDCCTGVPSVPASTRAASCCRAIVCRLPGPAVYD
jgi:hypothetical protein